MTERGWRLRADAASLRESVLAAARSARREQRLWRWTWAAAVVVIAAIPVNLLVNRIGVAIARSSGVRGASGLPPELQGVVRVAGLPGPKGPPIPRSVEEIR